MLIPPVQCLKEKAKENALGNRSSLITLKIATKESVERQQTRLEMNIEVRDVIGKTNCNSERLNYKENNYKINSSKYIHK